MAFAPKEPFLPVTNRINVLHFDLAVRPYPAAYSNAMKHIKDLPLSKLYSKSGLLQSAMVQMPKQYWNEVEVCKIQPRGSTRSCSSHKMSQYLMAVDSKPNT